MRPCDSARGVFTAEGRAGFGLSASVGAVLTARFDDFLRGGNVDSLTAPQESWARCDQHAGVMLGLRCCLCNAGDRGLCTCQQRPRFLASLGTTNRANLSSRNSVIPSGARDLGFCLRQQLRRRGQEPRSLALLGTTSRFGVRESSLIGGSRFRRRLRCRRIRAWHRARGDFSRPSRLPQANHQPDGSDKQKWGRIKPRCGARNCNARYRAAGNSHRRVAHPVEEHQQSVEPR